MWSLLFMAFGHILCCIVVGLLAKTYLDVDQMIFAGIAVKAYSMLFILNVLNFNNMFNNRLLNKILWIR